MRAASATLTTILVAAFAAGCASHGHHEPVRQPTRLAQILETGALRVGMSGEQPPLNMTAKTGEIVGLEVALARALASAMGVRMEIVRTPFPKLLDALEAGEIDLIMSGMTITAQRNLRVVFVGPYFVSGQSLLSRRTEMLAASVEELNVPELRFAALSSSTSEAWVRGALPRATLVPTQSLDAGIQLVIDDKVDAFVADREICFFGMLRHPEADLATRAEPFTVEPIGIALPPDDHQLTNLVANYLGALEMQGVLHRARSFWFEDKTWVEGLR